jgi:hypothetical protein
MPPTRCDWKMLGVKQICIVIQEATPRRHRTKIPALAAFGSSPKSASSVAMMAASGRYVRSDSAE